MNIICYHLVGSPLGDVGIVWQNGGDAPSIVRVMLSYPGRSTVDRIREQYPGAAEGYVKALGQLCEGIRGALEGDRVDFSLNGVGIDRCPEFQRRVLNETMRIPRGRVTSYGDLAEEIHAPGAARAVGTALARNPFPLVIPCHRVVKANRLVGRFGGGSEMKKVLLLLEGVAMDARGRIPPAFFR